MNPNPMVRAFGYGPAGKRCKHCIQLFKKQYAGTYYKFDFRINTIGPGSDHRVNWSACKKFKQKELKHR